MSLQLPLTLKLPGGREVAANAKGRTSIDATQARVKAFSFVRYNGGVTLHQLGMRRVLKNPSDVQGVEFHSTETLRSLRRAMEGKQAFKLSLFSINLIWTAHIPTLGLQ